MNRRMVVLWTAWAVLLVLTAVDLAWHYPQLPDRMATHFNASGVPDGWSSRPGFLTATTVTTVILSLLFPGLRLLMHVLPARWINLPRHAYWFAPERAPYTRALVGEWILWLGLMMLATVSGLNHLIMRANLNPPPDLGPWPWVIVGGNLFLTLVLVGFLMARLLRPLR